MVCIGHSYSPSPHLAMHASVPGRACAWFFASRLSLLEIATKNMVFRVKCQRINVSPAKKQEFPPDSPVSTGANPSPALGHPAFGSHCCKSGLPTDTVRTFTCPDSNKRGVFLLLLNLICKHSPKQNLQAGDPGCLHCPAFAKWISY